IVLALRQSPDLFHYTTLFRSGETGERALVVHDGRAGEVLHALREQPAVRAPDPVRDDRVRDREVRPEDEVDPELRAAGCSRRARSEEHTSELQSQSNLVCRLL